MTTTSELQDRWAAALMPNYGVPPVALVSGAGAEVTDAEGDTYLDLLAGIAVNLLGHAHPAIIEAVTAQLATLGHTSNLVATGPGIELAENLIARVDTDQPVRVFLCNSGTEANEAAFKIARLTGRTGMVAAEGSFHGRTMGSLALTGQPDKRTPFAPLPGDVVHVPYGDADALAAVVDETTAAVFLEPIMGEAGVIVPPTDYLRRAREITSAAGALLILDEIQTGVARTGSFFAHQAAGITPDVITLAKGLGGGLPIGACIGIGPAAELMQPGKHGTTFGGNPVCAAAALAVLRTVDAEDLAGHADRLGKQIRAGIEDLGHPLIEAVDGAGLLIGLGLTEPLAREVETAARAAGFLINAAKPNRLRLAPPLILTEQQAMSFVAALPDILAAAQRAGAASAEQPVSTPAEQLVPPPAEQPVPNGKDQ